MKGIITKVEVLEESDYNNIGEKHMIEFEELPTLRKRFAVVDTDKALWATSVVTQLQVIDEKTTVVTTTYSVYVLTVE
jgi:hypothetical protein